MLDPLKPNPKGKSRKRPKLLPPGPQLQKRGKFFIALQFLSRNVPR